MQELYIDSDKFESVWQRVTADSQTRAGMQTAPHAACPSAVCSEGKAVSGDAAKLKRFMDEADYIARYCSAAAAKCPGRISKTLCCVAENERKHLKRLRAEYFVLTGCTYCPDDTRIAVCTVSETLRAICTQLSGCAAEYYEAAENAPVSLACTYRAFARDEEKNAKSVLCLIESMIC